MSKNVVFYIYQTIPLLHLRLLLLWCYFLCWYFLESLF